MSLLFHPVNATRPQNPLETQKTTEVNYFFTSHVLEQWLYPRLLKQTNLQGCQIYWQITIIPVLLLKYMAGYEKNGSTNYVIQQYLATANGIKH